MRDQGVKRKRTYQEDKKKQETSKRKKRNRVQVGEVRKIRKTEAVNEIENWSTNIQKSQFTIPI